MLSSARMVSSFDSTPARKEPHLEVAFDVVGGDAMSNANGRLIQCLLNQTNAWSFGVLGVTRSLRKWNCKPWHLVVYDMLNGTLSNFKASSGTSGSLRRGVRSSTVRVARKVKGRVGIGDVRQRDKNRD